MGGSWRYTPKSRVKPDLHPKKTMICIWWDWEGMVHCKMLERNATVNKKLYIAQLHPVIIYSTEKTPSTRPNHISSRQHQASCCTSHQSHIPRARMGGLSASAIFSRPCIHRLLSFPLFVKPYEGRYLQQ